MLPILLSLMAAQASDLPQTSRSYDLTLTVDPETRHVDGTAEIRFTNPSLVPLDRIPVHLYLNAYANGGSTWMTDDRGLNRGAFNEYGRFKESEDDAWGWTRLTSVTAMGPDGSLDVPYAFIAPEDGNPHDRSLAELRLPVPVEPGETLQLSFVFESRLPEMSPRTGVAEDFVLVGHAFPSLGLLEVPEAPPDDPEIPQPTWRAHQYHGQTEFFAAFADYRATITAPEGWLVDGTGTLTPSDELPDDGVWTLEQRAVHDFSFVVVNNQQDRWVEHTRPSGGTIRLHFIAPPERTATLDRVQVAVEHGLDFLDAKLGPYPYDSLTVVIPPPSANNSEAIEFAGMFLALNGTATMERWPFDRASIPELVALHELCHQYFQGLVATDEVAHGWLDEGFTDYWGQRILVDMYGKEQSAGTILGTPLDATTVRNLGSRSLEQHEPRDALWSSPTYLYNRGRWSTHIYGRMAAILTTGERLFGEAHSDAVHKAWFEAGKFRHPGPEDLLRVAYSQGGQAYGDFLQEALTRTRTPDYSLDRTSCWEREAPVGHVYDGDELIYVSLADRSDFDNRLALEFDPDFRDGRISVEITEGASPPQPGRVRMVEMTGTYDDPDPDQPLHLSMVRFEGPGWKHLPVEVELEFEDGAVFRHTWQGGSVWWTYRVLYPSPLARAQVDPDGKIALDAWPDNNGKLETEHPDRARDWTVWFTAGLAWMSSSAGWWL